MKKKSAPKKKAPAKRKAKKLPKRAASGRFKK